MGGYSIVRQVVGQAPEVTLASGIASQPAQNVLAKRPRPPVYKAAFYHYRSDEPFPKHLLAAMWVLCPRCELENKRAAQYRPLDIEKHCLADHGMTLDQLVNAHPERVRIGSLAEWREP